mgnify:CR=1 FL=1
MSVCYRTLALGACLWAVGACTAQTVDVDDPQQPAIQTPTPSLWAPAMVFSQEPNGDSWRDASRWVMSYQDGRLQKMSSETRTPKGWVAGEWFSFEYDPAGRIDRTTAGDDSQAPGIARSRVDYSYDSQSRVLEHSRLVATPTPAGCVFGVSPACDLEFVKRDTYAYTFDDHGRVQTLELLRHVPHGDEVRRRLEFAYAGGGRLATITSWFTIGGADLALSGREAFEYDGQGRATRLTTSYVDADPGWVSSKRVNWTWNPNGRISEQRREVRDGAGWRNIERETIAYEQAGQIEAVTGEVFTADGWQATQRHEYVHTTDGDSSTFAAFRLEPQAPIRELMVWAYGEVHPGHGP